MNDRAPAPPGEESAEDARIYLHGGQIVVARGPTQVSTILGSCVAVCLWDPAGRIGGMNHFLLPRRISAGNDAERYGDLATAKLIERLRSCGASTSRMRAKLFGGAAVMPNGAGPEPQDHLGARNVAAARQVLREAGIPVIAEDSGGHKGRRIVFHTANGNVFLKRLS